MSSDSSAVTDSLRKKATLQIESAILPFREFAGKPEEAHQYAVDVVRGAESTCTSKESFRDQLMAVLSNIKSLDGELHLFHSGEALGRADPMTIRSTKQVEKQERDRRKRARENTVYDNTSMICTKCKLVRRDRLNVNHLALDSEQAGSHFEFNYDNQCECSSHSDTERSSSTSEGSDGDHSDAESCTEA